MTRKETLNGSKYVKLVGVVLVSVSAYVVVWAGANLDFVGFVCRFLFGNFPPIDRNN